ncbi:glycosyltransferase family 4 protein [Thermodesulfobacteriota bacterium]
MKNSIQRPLKVLFVLDKLSGRLGKKRRYSLPRMLGQKGHNVKVVCFPSRDSDYQWVVESIGLKHIDIIGIRENNFIQRFNNINRIIDSYKPDIVHMVAQHRYYLYPAMRKLINPLNKEKWIVDFDSPPLWTKESHWLKNKLNFIFQIGFDGISTTEKENVYKRFNRSLRPIYEVSIGIDVDAIKTKEYNNEDTMIKIRKFIYIGNVARMRKLDLLIEAISDVHKKISGSQEIHFDFFGAGDSVDEFRAAIKKKKLEELIKYKGLIQQEELFQLMCNYDAGISYIPYEMYDNAPPLKTLEYMAAGIFAIGSDTQGNKLYIENGQNGIEFKNTKESIANVLIDSIENGLPKYYIDNALKGISKYDWSEVVNNNLIPMYHDLLMG